METNIASRYNEKMTKNTKLGNITTILLFAILSLLLGVQVFKKFNNAYILHAILPTSGGIERNSEIRCLGVEVGNVSSIEINGNMTFAQLMIDKHTKLPVSSKFEIKSGGLFQESPAS